ncbi:MAG: hypothetical protein JW894_13905 [Bacteroidales bacterium]|nr:hypothetical protein [Bacteroidales bacterium]
MNEISPAFFGRSFGEITNDYINGPGKYISPVFHVATIVIFILIILNGNKHKDKFTLYFLINYTWIFLYAGLYMSYMFFQKMGIYFLVFWGAIPFLLFFILYQWLREFRVKKNNLTLKRIPYYRFIILPVILFGFWYPTYKWTGGFQFEIKDFLFSFYGLMPCPTTIVVLGLLTLKYPDVNKGLFYSLTLFSVMVGTAQFAIGYVPDYPLAITGYYSVLLIAFDKLHFIFLK